MNLENFISCRYCGTLYEKKSLRVKQVSKCTICGSIIEKNVENAPLKLLCFSLASLSFFIIAIIYPIVTVSISGIVTKAYIFSGTIELLNIGYQFLALLVILIGLIFPLIKVFLMIYVGISVYFDKYFYGVDFFYKILKEFREWAMSEIFVIGVLVSYVKLQDLATVSFNEGFYALFLAMLFSIAANLNISSTIFWKKIIAWRE